MQRKLTAHIEFTVQDATGPNLKELVFEVIDSDGDRLAYVSSIDEAADTIRDTIDEHGVFNVDVF